jgi:hypothetical protein
VGSSDDEKWLKSRPSSPKSGQAYDLTPPEPPGWDAELSGRVYVDDQSAAVYATREEAPLRSVIVPAIRLRFTETSSGCAYLIQRQMIGSYGWTEVSGWDQEIDLVAEEFELIDKAVLETEGYQYRIKSRSQAGLLARDWQFISFDPVS